MELKEGYIFEPVSQKQRKSAEEEFVKQEFIKTLVNEYKSPLSDLGTEFPIKIGSITKKIDIAIFKNEEDHLQENNILIVECKAPKIFNS